MATTRRLATVILAALFSAWPLPVSAQITPVTVPDSQVGIVNITTANNALQAAIQAFAATPSAANAAALATAQNNYNAAVSGNATTTVTNPSTVLGGSWPVASGQASAIFAAPGGTLLFSAQPVTNNGKFYLGTNDVATVEPFKFEKSGFPRAIGNFGTATITNSSFSNNFDSAIYNTGAGSIVTIINSSFSGNATPFGAAMTNGGTAMILGSSFSGNRSGFGGAINNDGALTLIDSNFIGNIAHNSQSNALGGAIANSFASRIGEINLVVSASHTSTFSGNTAEGQASSIFFDVGDLKVNVAAGGLLDMRDPMSGAPASVSEVGQGVWALGGANVFGTSPTFPNGRPTMFSVNSGTLYLYAAGEVANPSNSNGQVAAGTIALNAGGSSFTLGAGATLVAAGANSISVHGDVLLADGATIRGGTAADGSLVHVPLSGGITSRLDLSATGGVGLEGQLTVQAVAPDDTFTLAADLANAPGSRGSLLVPGAGTVILTGANDYSGATSVDAGTLQAGATGTFPVSSAFTVAAGAKLDLNNFNQSIGSLTGAGSVTLGSATLTTGNDNTSTTFAGIISGDGGLTKVGSGTFTLTGENTYSGGTNFNGGILAVEGAAQLGTGPLTFNGGTLEDLSGRILQEAEHITLGPAGGTFLADPGSVSTLSGIIEGPGSFTKLGPGTLILTGLNTYSGGTSIQDGTLVVGTLVTADQPISTALGTGNVFLDPGTLRTTSASTGVPLIIKVGGNYTQAAGGTLVLGIGGTQGEQYDHVQVNGSATLGGTLVVNSLGGFHPANLNLFEVLSSGGKRSGEFATVTDNLNIDPNLRRVDIYAPNGAALLYIATAAPTPTPPTPGPSPSPTPVPPKPPIIDVIPKPLPPVNPDEPLPASFLLAALNPTAEQLTSMFEISISGANTQRFNLTDRMTQIRRGSTGFVSPVAPAPPPAPTGKEIGKKEVVPPAFVPGPTNRWGVWVNGWGDWVNVNDDDGAKGYNFTTGGVSVGVDYRITDYLALGIFGTYAHTWTSLNPGSIDVNTGRGGLYATYWNQGFYINGGVYAGGNSYDTSRNELTNTLANGSASGYEVSTFVDTGYDFHFGDLSVGPVFAAQYTTVHIDGFTERGSFLPLNIHSDSEESWRTDLGVQASYAWHVGNVIVIPSLWAAWEHEYKYSRLPITFSSPVFGGVSATAFGPQEGHDSAIINAGVGTQWTPRISTYVGYQGQLGRDNYDANGVTGTISFSF